jgi:uncharacterized lipoprotein YmbA
MTGRRPEALASLALLLAAAAAGGCVSLKRTPEARYFVLRPLLEPSPPADRLPEGAVGLLPVRLPEHLLRPQLVLWAGPDELRLDEFLRWGEPLDAGVSRVLAGNLAALLPADRLVRAPWPAALVPRCRIALELRAFGAQPDGRVSLEGSWVLLAGRGEGVLARHDFALTRGPLAREPGGGVEPALAVGAMDELLAGLAREIAAAVRALPPQESAASPH